MCEVELVLCVIGRGCLCHRTGTALGSTGTVCRRTGEL